MPAPEPIGLARNSPPGAVSEQAEPAYLTVEQVATRIGVNRNTLYAQIAAGAFPPARRIGRRIVIPLRALLAWEAGE